MIDQANITSGIDIFDVKLKSLKKNMFAFGVNVAKLMLSLESDEDNYQRFRCNMVSVDTCI